MPKLNPPTRDETIARLATEWRQSGLIPGTVFLLHSGVKRTLQRTESWGNKLTPADVVESFLHALGPDGTLVLPLFNYDFPRGVPFDIRTTPSQVGALSNAGRLDPRAVRTGHPIYSFAAIGARAGDFRNVRNYSGYGADSPFAMVHKMSGQIGVLDVIENDSMTFYHYVEEMLAVPYRFHKRFNGKWTGDDGLQQDREFGLYVRFIEAEYEVHIAVDPMGEKLWEIGAYSGFRPLQDNGLRVIDSVRIYDETASVIESGKAEGLLYSVRRGKEPGRSGA